MDKIFTYDELKELFKEDNEPLGKGAFGAVRPLDDFTLIKTYLSETRDRSVDEMISLFREKKEAQEARFIKTPDLMTREKRVIKSRKALYKTSKSSGLIRGIAYYDGYAFGTLLRWYKNYLTLNRMNVHNLSKEQIDILLFNLDELMQDFYDNYIYPMDIKEGNILFHPRTLDVKMIDLEDGLVDFQDEFNSYDFDTCEDKVQKLKNRLLK